MHCNGPLPQVPCRTNMQRLSSELKKKEYKDWLYIIPRDKHILIVRFTFCNSLFLSTSHFGRRWCRRQSDFYTAEQSQESTEEKSKAEVTRHHHRHPQIPLLDLGSGSFWWRKHAGYDKQKDKATYWSSEATATKSSLSDSMITSGLMGFLRGLRLAMERK